jgi:hypothetical protein
VPSELADRFKTDPGKTVRRKPVNGKQPHHTDLATKVAGAGVLVQSAAPESV